MIFSIVFTILCVLLLPIRGKIYTACELAKELYLTHKLEKDDIGYHLCIARTFLGPMDTIFKGSQIGIYKITREWWCNEHFPGGHCHIKCSSLIDDYIDDDVKCAQEIIRRLGVKAWDLSRESCESDFIKMRECLRNKVRENLRTSKNKADCPQIQKIVKKVGNSTVVETCGKPYQSRGVIVGGDSLSFNQRGLFPWVATLVYSNNNEYFCGAVLISTKRVLTAAHCMQPKGIVHQLVPKDIKILLGVFNMNDAFEIGRVVLAVEKIRVHSSWNPFTERYEGDLAVFSMESEVQLGRFIQPVCIHPPNSYLLSISEGTVVGYGTSSPISPSPEKIPKIINLPIHKNEDCYLHNNEFARISSSNTFCVGTGNGSGVCSGDSGSGFYVNYEGTYYLRGIVSASFAPIGMLCNVNDYAVITSVSNYYDWIVNDTNSVQPSTTTTESMPTTTTRRSTTEYPLMQELQLLSSKVRDDKEKDEDAYILPY